MRFELTILGINAATAGNGRHLTSQVLNVQEQLFLIDCGEGCQFHLQKYRIKASKIQHIFISHLHGDHVFGLIGLLSNWGLSGRKSALHIYSPEPDKLRQILLPPLELTGCHLGFEIHFLPTNAEKSELIFENAQLSVHSIPLEHRVPAAGFLFREKKSHFRLKEGVLERYKIPQSVVLAVKKGEDVQNADGELISNQLLTNPPAKTRSFAFCSDTIYKESIVPIVQNVDLLYHEATFLSEQIAKAESTKHSTAAQAATIAQKAAVGRLILGHFSVRYDDLSPFLAEAQPIFANTVIGEEGSTYSIPYQTEPNEDENAGL